LIWRDIEEKKKNMSLRVMIGTLGAYDRKKNFENPFSLFF
jgi:hypothetical protein